jgi:hypothetical protein
MQLLMGPIMGDQASKQVEIRRPVARLIVNADDFGYFSEVTRGIIDAMEAGVVTATGVMANGPALERWVDRLRSLTSVSVGVHLNTSLGEPLTAEMQDAVAGTFPRKGQMGLALISGRVPWSILFSEWRAQIRRCLTLGLRPVFLNSHEHLHVLPGLFSRLCDLATEFGIHHVRVPCTEWGPSHSLAGGARNAVLAVARLLAQKRPGEPRLIGISQSGRLDLKYCGWRFPRLSGGQAYELMCHPGWSDATALADPALAQYHDWEGELHTLMSEEFRRLLAWNRIELISFAGLK